MDIILLSAGKGERLLPLTKNTPKCLLEISDGITLLESQLTSFSRNSSIGQIIIILGYLAEQIESKIPSYLRYIDVDVKTIYNPFYDVSNNFMSLWCALPFMNNDFAVINGDDVFHSSVIDQIIQQENNICMVIDKKEKYEPEDMKVKIKGSCIIQVGKDIDKEDADGESIGMIRFRNQGAKQLKNSIKKMARQPESKDIFWLAAVQDLINRGFEVRYIEIPKDKWSEVDLHPDLKYVREKVFHYIPKTIFGDNSGK